MGLVRQVKGERRINPFVLRWSFMLTTFLQLDQLVAVTQKMRL